MTIAVHATCTALAFRPGLVDAIVELGGRLGLEMVVPKAQTCCGLTAWDAGDVGAARDAARHALTVFRGYETVVTASPSCLQMFQQHIPTLLAGEKEAGEAATLAGRAQTWEAFLAKRADTEPLDVRFEGRIAYFKPCRHDDDASARRLLARVRGATVLPDPARQCCGYGGNMVWRHPELSRAIAAPVVTALRLSRPDLVITSDVGCLLQLEPLLREAAGVPMRHIAEFLAQPVL